MVPGLQVYAPFLSAGKAVVDAEFEVMDLTLCNSTEAESIDFIVKVCHPHGGPFEGSVLTAGAFYRLRLLLLTLLLTLKTHVLGGQMTRNYSSVVVGFGGGVVGDAAVTATGVSAAVLCGSGNHYQ